MSALQGLVDEVQAAAPGLSDEVLADWAMYEKWCKVHGLEPLREPNDDPSAEMVLLMFLQAHEDTRRVCYATLRAISRSVASIYQHRGKPDPRGEAAAFYLAEARDRLGAIRERPVDAFSIEQVRAIVETRAGIGMGQSIPAMRALTALLDLSGLDVTRPALQLLRQTQRSDCLATDNEVSVGVGPLLVRASKETHPDHFRALREVLDEASDERPFWFYQPGPALLIKNLNEALERAQGHRGSAWVNHTDPRYTSVTQDVGYLLLGLVTGHRHAELKRLRMGMIRTTADGYAYTLREHKGAKLSGRMGGRERPWEVELPHAKRNKECVSHCAACALGRQLEQRRLEGARPTDLVFVADDRCSPVDPNTALKSVKRAWRAGAKFLNEQGGARQDLLETPKIGTRSMRVTAATLGRAGGMSLFDVADLLQHQTAKVTLLYIRKLDETAVSEFTLPL